MSIKHASKLRENAAVNATVPIGEIAMETGAIHIQCRAEQVVG